MPVAPLAGKIVIDTNNYYPQRDGHIPELDNEIDDDRRAAAGAPADVEGRQGVQPHLRRRAHHARPAGRHAEPPRARHCRRRRRREGDAYAAARPVRLRHGRRRPAEGGLAHPARHARLRPAAHRRGAAQGPRGGEALPRTNDSAAEALGTTYCSPCSSTRVRVWQTLITDDIVWELDPVCAAKALNVPILGL